MSNEDNTLSERYRALELEMMKHEPRVTAEDVEAVDLFFRLNAVAGWLAHEKRDPGQLKRCARGILRAVVDVETAAGEGSHQDLVKCAEKIASILEAGDLAHADLSRIERLAAGDLREPGTVGVQSQRWRSGVGLEPEYVRKVRERLIAESDSETVETRWDNPITGRDETRIQYWIDTDYGPATCQIGTVIVDVDTGETTAINVDPDYIDLDHYRLNEANQLTEKA